MPAIPRFCDTFRQPCVTGKTSLASRLVARLNQIHDEHVPGCIHAPIASFIPMDGYHLSRAQLSAMSDPIEAHARRGAAFTFDAPSFLKLVQRLREPLAPETKTLHAPSFDHAIKDPVQNDISIPPSARVIVFEGNYLSLDQGDWRLAAELMDELWFVKVDSKVARRRLIARHLKAGIAGNASEAAKRADENDLVNGQQILDQRLNVQEIVESVEDERWAVRGE